MRTLLALAIAPSRSRQAGVTLLELIVTVIIAAILVALALPSFQSTINSSRVSGPANEIVSTLQLARMEAFRRGERTVVCRSENADTAAPSCTTSAGNWGGWLAFVDVDANGNVNGTDVVLRATTVNAPAVVVPSPLISSGSNSIVFRADGLARASSGALLVAKVRVCVPTTTPPQNARDVAISGGSRVSVARSNAAGACAAPANS
ncbi:MAG: GspH/FimT family pseudopilin [Xanthomonadales bacterium]|nr:GspH/FimT family pseudopilin [Xanthomonadales bacterium]